MVWWDLSFKPQGKFRFDMLKKTREKKRPCATLKIFGVIFPQHTSNTKNAFRETLKKIEIIFPPKSQIQKMSTTTPPDLAPPPPSRKFEKKREKKRKFEKIFPECQYIKMYSEKIREKKRKFEKNFFPKKNQIQKMSTTTPPRSGTPPPLRENSRKKEKKRENLRKFEKIFPPHTANTKNEFDNNSFTCTPPPDLDPPPRSGPPPPPDLDPVF